MRLSVVGLALSLTGFLAYEAVTEVWLLRLVQHSPQSAEERHLLVEQLEGAARWMPNEPRLHSALARVHLTRASLEEANGAMLAAREALQVAAREAPLDARIPYALAWVHLRLGEPGLAAPYAARALDLDPHNPEYVYGQGRVREAQGRYGDAAAAYRDALVRANNPRIERRLWHLNERGHGPAP